MQIDRYKIKGVLGRGAMSSVHRAWDPKLHREVAVKVVYRDVSDKPKGRERFHREARAIAALKHPNIVEIYDYSGTESSSLYLVMELLDGDDLYEIMAKNGPMPEPIVAAVGHEICRALEVAHAAGIIHRDIKPENVLLNADGRVVLTDFGGVKSFQEDTAVADHPQKTDIIGTPGFMAPEQIRCAELGPHTDVFALGALLYNIVTAELPFSGDVLLETLQDVVAGRFIDPRRFKPDIDGDLCAVLECCLAAKPGQRFRSAADVRKALKGILGSYGVTDLRDDLQEYMADPTGYGESVDRRSLEHLYQRLRHAVQERDADSTAALRARILSIRPDDRQADEIIAAEGRAASSPADGRRWTAVPPARGAWMALGVALAVTVGAGLVAYNLHSPRAEPRRSEDPTAQSTAESATDSPPLQEPSPGEDPTQNRSRVRVRVEMRGGPAYVLIDNKRRGRWSRKTVTLPQGRHVIEVRGRGKRLRRTFVLDPNNPVAIVFDLKRGKVQGPVPLKRE